MVLPNQIDADAAAWRNQTEYVIAISTAVFSGALFLLDSGLGGSDEVLKASGFRALSVNFFFFFSLARLLYINRVKTGTIFAWTSGVFDTLFLSAALYSFSFQHETLVATLKAPGFVFYFVLIGLHAMRFDAKLVFAIGGLSATIWAAILVQFIFQGTEQGVTYEAYYSSSAILVGVEAQKILGLLGFTAMLGVGMRRANSLLVDAAARKFTEVKLEEAQNAAQVKTEFLANMSHEIRTPMNGVLGMTQILSTTELSHEQSEYVGTIQRSGDALLTIINDILDFSKIEAGKLRLDKAAFNLREACEDIVTLLGVTARQKNIELVMNLQADAPMSVVGDAGRLRQILTNLVGNAIKFTQTGYVLVDVSGVEVNGRVQLSFRIEDTGIGIEQDKLDTIFSKFAQADGSTTRQYGGTGLGLSISQSLVELMGGVIRVSSKPDAGSIFTFTVEMQTDRRQQSDTTRPPPVNLAKVPILIVDDLAVNRDILKVQIEQLGGHPDVVSNARDAVATLVSAQKSERPYAMLITDYQMPDIDGLKLVEAIRARRQFDDLQIIVLSSIDSSETKLKFSAQDIVSYMTKPSRAKDLETAIYDAVRRSRKARLPAHGREDADAPMTDQARVSA